MGQASAASNERAGSGVRRRSSWATGSGPSTQDLPRVRRHLRSASGVDVAADVQQGEDRDKSVGTRRRGGQTRFRSPCRPARSTADLLGGPAQPRPPTSSAEQAQPTRPDSGRRTPQTSTSPCESDLRDVFRIVTAGPVASLDLPAPQAHSRATACSDHRRPNPIGGSRQGARSSPTGLRSPMRDLEIPDSRVVRKVVSRAARQLRWWS